jgi:hypothetical protein
MFVRPGHIGNRTYLRHGDNRAPNGLSRGCFFLLQIEISEITVDEADSQMSSATSLMPSLAATLPANVSPIFWFSTCRPAH